MSLPEALAPMAQYAQWINWVEVPSEPKPRKVPTCVVTGASINPHDPSQWMTYERAAELVERVPGAKLGFVFAETDPFFFIDLDEPPVNGQWSEHTKSVLARFPGAAVEVSNSGKGLHIIGCADLLPDRRNKFGNPQIEFYQTKRFMALGRDAIGNAWLNWTDALKEFIPIGQTTGAELSDGPCDGWNGITDDDRLIAAMLASRGSANVVFGVRAHVADLWNADADKLAIMFPDPSGTRGFDHSSADAALMSHLAFWTGKDAARMDRLFRRSALMRDKYERRSDYRRDTIGGACGAVRAVYTAGDPETHVASPVTTQGPSESVDAPLEAMDAEGTSYLTTGQQKRFFQGCYYVRDRHRIFVPDGSLLKSEQFNAIYGGYDFQMSPDNTKPTKKAFEAFTENRAVRFPKVEGICFRPAQGRVVAEGQFKMVNLYVPAEIKRAEGDPTPFLNHVSKLFPDDNDRAIIMAYMAAIAQYPGAKFQWSPVIQGGEGNGKTLLMRVVEAAVGTRYTHYPSAENIHNEFNAWVEGTIFAGVEEIYTRDRREIIDKLKPLITNNRLEVQPKGVDQYTGDNFVKFIMCTNHRDAIIKTRDDRRYAVFFTPQQTLSDIQRDGMGGDYFPNLYRWLDHEHGYAIMANYLHTYEIPDALNPATNLHRAPETSMTDQVIEESRGGIEMEILEAVESESVGFRQGWISSHVLDDMQSWKRLGRSKRREILQALGYEPHPALNQSRATCKIPFEGNKRPTLYCKVGCLAYGIVDPNAATSAYMKAQGYADAAPVLTMANDNK